MASLQPRSGPLGQRLAAHLLRRTTFHYTKGRIDAFAALTADQAVEQLLLLPAPTIPEPVDFETGQPWINSGVDPISQNGVLRLFIKGWWTYQSLLDPSMGHKMMLFLHSNFVVADIEGPAAEYFDYLGLLRFYAFGNLKTLARKVTLDNQMLRYLDNTQNNKDNPNENYAREFFELFTIGKGPQAGPGDYTNYTEADIAAAARLLTGFKVQPDRQNIDPDTGLPTGRTALFFHDTNDKQFSAAFQNTLIAGRNTHPGMHTELDEFVDMVFGQAATAENFCRKLYRFFVHSQIDQEIEQDIIQPLAQTMISNNYELAPVLRQLLKSVHFYDEDDSNNSDEIIGGLVKSPLELIQHTLAYFHVPIPDPVADPQLHYDTFYRRSLFNNYFPLSGMDLFRPSDVAGYPAYYQEPGFQTNWLNSTSLITRYQMPKSLIRGKRIRYTGASLGTQLDIVDYVKNNIDNPADASDLVTELLEDLFPEMSDPDRFDFYLNEMFLNGIPAYDWTEDWLNFMQSGDDAEVRPALESLVNSLLFSQEFQAM